ncbi:MAG: beta-fructofuranosidase [Fusicatenibacter sp.]|nr:beta-fructofuranosidase [Fusicatenibacter sp.]
MGKLWYKPEQAWVGDLIPYWENGTYYAFYLHDPRIRDKEYAEETTWHLVTTKDFVHLDNKGEAIRRGGDDRPNKNAYTGSVLRDQDGLCHAFYTAYNADIKINGKSVQSVMQAVGSDPEHLETVEDFLFTADGVLYEEFDWRDPYVFWNEQEECYYMLLAARKKGGGKLRGGCIALCKSQDLFHWTYERPFYQPEMYITMECPEVFRMGEYWYLVFSTFSDRFTTHYRMAKSLHGPWIIPKDDVFDTRANYAIKTASDGRNRYAFGWIASKYGNCDFGPWEWGGTMVFHEIVQEAKTGLLKIKPIPGVKDFYTQTEEKKPVTVYHGSVKEKEGMLELRSETLGAALYPVCGDCFSLELCFKVEKAHEFGIVLHADDRMETGYFLRMDPQRQEAAWDQWPRAEQGFYQWQIKGDVPCQIETARHLPDTAEFHMLILREEDICVVYINDEIALSTRMYDHKGGYAGIYVVQGTVQLLKYVLKK